MQLLKTLFVLLFATLISAVALPQDTDTDTDTDTAIDASFTGVLTEQSADGKQYTFSIYDNGGLEGTIVVTDDDPAQLAINSFDASGAEIGGDASDGAAGQAFRSAVACNNACKIRAFIKKYGRRAIKFISCLGRRIPPPCWLKIFECMVSPDPFRCFQGILCSATIIRGCARG